MPTEATPLAQVVLELATTFTEGPTVELLLGEDTATEANAGIAKARMDIKDERRKIRMFRSPQRNPSAVTAGICKTHIFALQFRVYRATIECGYRPLVKRLYAGTINGAWRKPMIIQLYSQNRYG